MSSNEDIGAKAWPFPSHSLPLLPRPRDLTLTEHAHLSSLLRLAVPALPLETPNRAVIQAGPPLWNAISEDLSPRTTN